MRTYFIYNGQDQLGPFLLEELKSQKITAKTLVWFEGLSGWTTVENIQELGGIVNSPPPPPGHHFNQSPPDPLASPVYVINPTDNTFSWRPLVLTGITLAIIIIAFLIYHNSTQAKAIQQLRTEQQKLDIAVQTKENFERKKEQEVAQKNKLFRNNWAKYISVTNNKYRYSELGGIYGLWVIATNNSDYAIEEIIATVTYIKANGDVWKTVEVPVYNIGAHSEKGVGVPDVERGTSVIIGINSMGSKAAQFCYTSGNWANRVIDPYFCK